MYFITVFRMLTTFYLGYCIHYLIIIIRCLLGEVLSHCESDQKKIQAMAALSESKV